MGQITVGSRGGLLRGYFVRRPHFFESNPLLTASHKSKLEGTLMKSLYQFGLASALILLMNMVPAKAFASKSPGVASSHSHQYHDHTPTVHIHGSHPHHG